MFSNNVKTIFNLIINKEILVGGRVGKKCLMYKRKAMKISPKLREKKII